MKIDSDEALGGLGSKFEEASSLSAYWEDLCSRALHEEETLESIDFRRGSRHGNWRDHLRPLRDHWSSLDEEKRRYLVAQAFLLEQARIVECPDPY